jgi:polyferredoxin
MMSRKYHRSRRFAGAILLATLIGVPFWKVHGESAFRFDVPSLRLLLFGSEIWLQDFFIVLVAIIFLIFLGMFITTLFGRLWCGWLCPQTVISDATSFLDSQGGRGSASLIAGYAAAVFASALIAMSLIGYFVSPYELIPLLRLGDTQAKIVFGSWLVLGGLAFLDMVVLRRSFCATICPYAKLQSVLFDDRTLLVAFDPSREQECRACNACMNVCPVKVDIRTGTHLACIHCAECADACTSRMASRNRKSLIGYSFGIPGRQGRGFRVNPLISGVITAASLLFLLYLAVLRIPFDVIVLPQYALTTVQADGSVANTYILSLRNTGRSDIELDLDVTASSGLARSSPARIFLRKGTDIAKVPVLVTLTGLPKAEQHPLMVTLTIRSQQINKSIVKTTYFTMPKKN